MASEAAHQFGIELSAENGRNFKLFDNRAHALGVGKDESEPRQPEFVQ